MTDEIKSAREIALAKVAAQSEEITAEDRLRWKYIPEGKKLGARIISSDVDVEEELGKIKSPERDYLLQGALSIIYSSIALPQGEVEKERNRKALEAVVKLKTDKASAGRVVAQIQNLFDHYETQGSTQKNHALEQLKTEYSRKLQQAIEQQLGSSASGMVADVENLPQFKEEKRRLVNQFDSQYSKMLAEYKEELKKIS